jgi:hypothetical protein
MNDTYGLALLLSSSSMVMGQMLTLLSGCEPWHSQATKAASNGGLRLPTGLTNCETVAC